MPGDTEETRRGFVELGGRAGDGALIRVRGRAHVHADGSLALEAREFKPVELRD